jgi:hypothetical protein
LRSNLAQGASHGVDLLAVKKLWVSPGVLMTSGAEGITVWL